MAKPRIVIVNYGMGNLKSVSNALGALGYSPVVSSDKEAISQSDGLILPGVGAFGEAMSNLTGLGIIETLREQVLEQKKPFLGICLGMQLLAEDSEEMGFHRGLGWIEGHVVKMKPPGNLRLPHVGWNSLETTKKEPLFLNIDSNPSYYFDHTYELVCDTAYTAAKCLYGTAIIAAIQRDNIFATQFHPEKSQIKGLRLLRNFLNYVESAAPASQHALIS